jgi:hypothetical protein
MVDSSNPNFDFAKQQVIHGLEKLAKFSSNMDKKYPTRGFAPFVQKLSDLESLIETTSGPCLSCNQINEIESFAQHLSSNQCFIDNYFTHHGFLPKLHQFWNLRQSIVNTNGKVEEIILWQLSKKRTFQDRLNALNLSLERTHQVQSVTNQIVDAVLRQTKNILSMISILLAIVIDIRKAIEQGGRIICVNGTQTYAGFLLNQWASDKNVDLAIRGPLQSSINLLHEENSMSLLKDERKFLPLIFGAAGIDFVYRFSTWGFKVPINLTLKDTQLNRIDII